MTPIMGDEIGEVHEIPINFEWGIDNFFSLSEEAGVYYTSPYFSYRGESWYLEIRPNGDADYDSVGYIDLSLVKESGNSPINVELSFAIKNVYGKKELERYCTEVFENMLEPFDILCFISRSELARRKAELVPFGILTVVCTFKTPESSGSASDISTVECSYCQNIFDAESVSSHEKKCTERPIKCPECSDVIRLHSWYDHECEKDRTEVSEKLIHDFKTAMLSGEHSDMIVKVKEEEFRLHKAILSARNPYFYSMFKNEMKEKSTGVVKIEDMEPDIFRSFIYFIYTGKVDKLSQKNVCDLYRASDKYQEDQLKKKCLHLMLNTLTVESFCDYFALALTLDAKELFQTAVEFFLTKEKEITHRVQWQIFVDDYPIEAKELYMKTLDYYVK